MTSPLSIRDTLSREGVKEWARPADFRYGQAIHDRGGVKIIESSSTMVEEWVGGLDGSVIEGGSQRRRTRFYLTGNELSWHCSGNPRDHQIFCKHCVALALAILDEK